MNKGHSLCVPLNVLSDLSLHVNGEAWGMNFKEKLLTLAMPLQRNFICFIKITIYSVHLNVKYMCVINYNNTWIDISLFPSIRNRRWENNISKNNLISLRNIIFLSLFHLRYKNRIGCLIENKSLIGLLFSHWIFMPCIISRLKSAMNISEQRNLLEFTFFPEVMIV